MTYKTLYEKIEEENRERVATQRHASGHSKKNDDIKYRNLCSSCLNDFATCISDPEFGCGNDNVFNCDAYKRAGSFKQM